MDKHQIKWLCKHGRIREQYDDFVGSSKVYWFQYWWWSRSFNHVGRQGSILDENPSSSNAGNTVVFDKRGCVIYNSNKKVIATADLVNNMFRLNSLSTQCAYTAKKSDDIILWHRRMGHLSLSGMKQLKNAADIDIFSLTNRKAIKCVTCAEGKQCCE